jgi:hypothetical protein
MKCPECGKFLKDVTAMVNGFDEIKEVEGYCRTHGKVRPTDWAYWDFYPEEGEQPAQQTGGWSFATNVKHKRGLYDDSSWVPARKKY